MESKIGYLLSDWENGIKTPLFWNTDTVPGLLISGITGGSKTVSAQLIVNQLLDAKVDISICDFKAGGDWDNIVPKYAEYTDCDDLLKAFYDSFLETIRNKGHEEKYIIFDEFSSYSLSKEPKAFKGLMSTCSHLAFMGRSFGYHQVYISQQFNSKVLDTAIREQFGVKLYMGQTISTESATMLFPNCEIDKSFHLPKYCGYISMPERELDIVQMPYLENAGKLKKLLELKGKALYG